MRPSSVDTSEPACTKRKMLSTKSSTSWPFTSRKYSAIGQRRQRDAQAHAGRLVHLAEDQGGLVEHARLGHLDAEVGALTGALAHAGEHRHATVLLGDPADHLGDEHGLAHAGAAEQADLAALQVRRQQVDDLDAGLEHLGLRARACRTPAPGGGCPSARDRRTSTASTSSGSPHTLKTWPSTCVADRHLDAVAGVAHRRAPGEAVGRLHADGPHPAVADLLGHLGQHRVGPRRRRRSSSSRAWLISGSEPRGNSTSTTGPAMATMRPSLSLRLGSVMVMLRCS